jgi:hypothetical protein
MPNLGLYVWSVIAVSAAAFILLGVAAVLWRHRNRTEQLRIIFGPEYDRAVRLYGTKARAETALESRRRRVREMGVHELSEAERDGFLMEWATIQSTATDNPVKTLVQANDLLSKIMESQGCHTDDEDIRKMDLALLHPAAADDYRAATNVLDRYRLGLATSEEIQGGVARFSDIFDQILGRADLRQRLRKVS